MKVFKRLIALVLSISLISAIFTGCVSINPNNSEKNLNKGQFVEYLGKYFGMNEYKKSESYFSDVNNEDSFFPYLQSCVEWKILDPQGEFFAKKKINREYALALMVKAIGEDISEMPSDSSFKDLAAVSVEMGIGKSTSWVYMHEGLTEKEALELLEKASAIYASAPIGQEYDRSKLASGLKIQSLEESELTHIKVNTGTVEIDNVESADNYKVGDVVLFGQGDNRKAQKIKKISKKEGKVVLSTESPQLEEVYEKIDFSGASTVQSASDIQLVEGAKLTSFNGQPVNENTEVEEKPTVEHIGRAKDVNTKEIYKKDKKIEGVDIGIELGFNNKGEIKGGGSFGGVKVGAGVGTSAEDDNYSKSELNSMKGEYLSKLDPKGNKILFGSVQDKGLEPKKDIIPPGSTKTHKVPEKKSAFSAGWELTGSISVTNIWIQSVVDVSIIPLRVNELSVTNNFKIDSSVSLKGKASFEKEIGTIRFLLGSTGFEIDAHLLVTATVSGEIKFSWALNSNTKCGYYSGNWKKTSTTTFENSLTGTFKLEWGAGLRFVLVASFIPFDKYNRIVNIDATYGASYSLMGKATNIIRVAGEKKLYRKGGDEDKAKIKYDDCILLCAETEVVKPIVKVKLGSDSRTLAHKLSLSFEAELIGKKGLFKKVTPKKEHFEFGLGKVKSCTLDTIEQYKFEEEPSTEDVTDLNEESSTTETYSGFTIGDYYLDMVPNSDEKVEVSLPKGKKMEDISVSIDNPDVATAVVSKENNAVIVSSHNEGLANVKISCKDAGELICVVEVAE